MPDFNARFYNVIKCGYYPFAADSDPELGGFAWLLEQLLAWSQNRTLEQTRLPMPTNALPTYLLNIARRGHTWVIVLWNEVPSTDGTVASVSANSRVGRPRMHGNPIAAGSIPGFPTYFVCLPDEDLVVTLKSEDRVVGLTGFKNFLSAFQDVGTSIADVDFDEDDPSRYEINGYRDEFEDVQNLHARFQLQLRRSGTQRAEILRQYQKIRKIVRVKEMDPTDQTDLALYQRGLIWIGLQGRPMQDKLKVKQEIEIDPTRAEVAAVIDSVMDELERGSNDVGFVLRGEANPIWLSGSIPGHELRVDAVPEDGVFDAGVLADSINRRRTVLMAAANQ